jgi:hypothetical protein
MGPSAQTKWGEYFHHCGWMSRYILDKTREFLPYTKQSSMDVDDATVKEIFDNPGD